MEFYRQQAEYGRTATVRVRAALVLREMTGVECDIDLTARPYPPDPSARRLPRAEQSAGAMSGAVSPSSSAGTGDFARQVRGSGRGSRARTVTVTVTGGHYVSVQFDGEEPVRLGAYDTSELIGALRAALHERRR
ncbi:MAG: hypothetical protein ACRDQ5_07510, partial [Sciscionella sp.]